MLDRIMILLTLVEHELPVSWGDVFMHIGLLLKDDLYLSWRLKHNYGTETLERF